MVGYQATTWRYQGHMEYIVFRIFGRGFNITEVETYRWNLFVSLIPQNNTLPLNVITLLFISNNKSLPLNPNNNTLPLIPNNNTLPLIPNNTLPFNS